MRGMIQFISHHTEKYDYIDSIRMALQGGCRWIQLRMKETPVSEIRATALIAQQMCKEHDATFIIDDHVELVKELKADGVHLGKNDMPISDARKILGEDYIIGGTANTIEDVMRHCADGVDYIGCGPFRYTTTKKNLSPVLGLQGYKDIMLEMKQRNLDVPVVAIGGITETDIPMIMQTGVSGIAISGAVLNAENPVEEMKRLINICNI